MINHIVFPDIGLDLNINRAAINLFGFPVYWYGLIIATGLILALLYGWHESKKAGIIQDDFLNMVIMAVPASIVGARLYYVIFSFSAYRHNLLSVFDIRSGGLAIYGAVIGAFLVVFFYCRLKKISLGKVLDILAIGLLIGQSIGRWGNFVNGEAFGSVTNLPWAMTIYQDGELIAENVHPTFLYESLWNAVGILVLLGYKKIRKFDGELFLGYLVWYGAGRMWIEGLRADSLYLGPIRVSQLLAIATVVAGISLIVWNYKKLKEKR